MLEREIEPEGYFVLHGEAVLQLAAKRDDELVFRGERHSIGDNAHGEINVHVEHCQKLTDCTGVPVFRVLCPCGNVAVLATPRADLHANFCCQKCFDKAREAVRKNLADMGVGFDVDVPEQVTNDRPA